jgi:electron transport complex protein RnfD
MWLISLYAAAAVVQSGLGDGGKSFHVAAAALSAALLSEFLVGLKTGRHTVLDGSAAASALVLTLLLPNGTPPILAAAGASFAIIITKMIFGGLGANWLNPAVSGWLFIRFSWPAAFAAATADTPVSFLADRIVNRTAGEPGFTWEILNQNGFFTGGNRLTQVFNDTVFSVFNMELPAGYLDFFAAPGPGIIGDRGIYALLLGSVVIIALELSRFSVSALYLAVYLMLIRIAGAVPMGGQLWEGDVLFGLFSGGALVTALLLLTDPATGPKSVFGKMMFAVLAAFLSFFFRYVESEPYGAFFAVALLNTISPLVRAVESRYIYKGRVEYGKHEN